MDKAQQFQIRMAAESAKLDLRGRSIRAAAFNAASGFADFAVRILSTAILARLVAPEDFGLIMMVTAITAIADQIRELGLSSATVQRPTITHAEVSNLFWVNIAIGLILTFAICLLSPAIANYYRDPRAVAVTCMLATNFIIGGMAVQHQALLTRQLKLGQTAAIRLIASVLSTILAIGLAMMDLGYWALAWREVARITIICAGMWICLRWVPSLPSRNTSIRSMVSFGANLTGANILGSVSASVDRFLLGRVAGAASVGIYRQAFQLITAPTDQLLSPLYQVMQPALSQLQSDPSRYRKFYLKALLCVCAVTMPLSLFVAVYSTELTLIILGPKWLECAPIIFILSLGTFVRQAVGSTALILITRGHGHRLLMLTVVSNITLVVFMTIGVKWGVYGIAIAEVSLTYGLMMPRIHYSVKDSPVTLTMFFATLIRPAIASLVMAGALLFIKPMFDNFGPFISLSMEAIIALILFFGTWMLMPGGRTELVRLLTDLHSAFSRKIKGVIDVASPVTG